MSKIIVSAFRAGNTLAQNWSKHEELLNVLSEYAGIKSLAVGSFKEEGQEVASQEVSVIFEASWLDNCPSRGQLIHKLLTLFNQDAVLFVQDNSQPERQPLVSLVTFDGDYIKYQFLGYWTAITEAESEQLEAFTFTQGAYYAAK